MAQTPTVLSGKVGILTINATVAKITAWTIRIENDVIAYATTGQTADANTQYWMNKLSHMNNATIDIEAWWTSESVATAKFTGTDYVLRPGTGSAGTVACSFVTGDAFSATVVVRSIEGGINIESNKPSTFRATLEVSGAVTYPT
jgi:hypothetical protein